MTEIIGFPLKYNFYHFNLRTDLPYQDTFDPSDWNYNLKPDILFRYYLSDREE